MAWQVHETKVNMVGTEGNRFTMEIRGYGYPTVSEAAVAAFENASISCVNGRALDIHSTRVVKLGRTVSATERAA